MGYEYEITSEDPTRHIVRWPDGSKVDVDGPWKLAAEIGKGRALLLSLNSSVGYLERCTKEASSKIRAVTEDFQEIASILRGATECIEVSHT